jgi:L,D-transpeptidase catalytic domain
MPLPEKPPAFSWRSHHGTYWYDNFGTNASQGCINLTWTDAAYLFGQTLPQTPADAAAGDSPQEATPLVILGN